jgi:hypothetical protein
MRQIDEFMLMVRIATFAGKTPEQVTAKDKVILGDIILFVQGLIDRAVQSERDYPHE